MSLLSAKFKVSFPDFNLNVDLNVQVKGFTVIFGPSGCGKTTLLRCLSGLERSPEGFLKIGEEIWQDEANGIFLPVSQRPIGYVFQEARLFSHLNVEGNLKYGYKRSSNPNGIFHFNQVMNIMSIESLLKRRPHQLSGGEKQRVAIARALLTCPRLLLMDEPLAALDLKRKQEILPYFQRVQAELNIPVFYVTHSLNEVLQLVDTMVLMDRGAVKSVGPVEETFSNLSLKNRIGHSLVGGVLDAVVVRQDEAYQLTVLEVKGQTLYIPRQEVLVGNKLRVHIHAGDVALAVSDTRGQTSVLNVLSGKVVEIDSGSKDDYMTHVKLDIGYPLLATITRKSLDTLKLKPGQVVYAHIKAIRMAHEFD